MSGAGKRHIAYLLLLLYIGYFAAVSYYIHPHIYRGIVYMHSHPYEKEDTNQAKEKQIPFEANHKHSAASFSTLNQLSNLLSFEQSLPVLLDVTFLLLGLCLVFQAIQKPFNQKRIFFSLRAPPFVVA